MYVENNVNFLITLTTTIDSFLKHTNIDPMPQTTPSMALRRFLNNADVSAHMLAHLPTETRAQSACKPLREAWDKVNGTPTALRAHGRYSSILHKWLARQLVLFFPDYSVYGSRYTLRDENVCLYLENKFLHDNACVRAISVVARYVIRAKCCPNAKKVQKQIALIMKDDFKQHLSKVLHDWHMKYEPKEAYENDPLSYLASFLACIFVPYQIVTWDTVICLRNARVANVLEQKAMKALGMPIDTINYGLDITLPHKMERLIDKYYWKAYARGLRSPLFLKQQLDKVVLLQPKHYIVDGFDKHDLNHLAGELGKLCTTTKHMKHVLSIHEYLRSLGEGGGLQTEQYLKTILPLLEEWLEYPPKQPARDYRENQRRAVYLRNYFQDLVATESYLLVASLCNELKLENLESILIEQYRQGFSGFS